jgi:phosphonate transport system substrate-binding protein
VYSAGVNAALTEGDEGPPMRVGVAVPEGHGDARAVTRERLEGFCDALGDALSVAVEPYGIAHYRELLEAMHEGRLDLAWLPPIVALKAAARGRTLPIALPVREGSSAFWSALFTRPGSSLKEPGDLVAERAAWVDRQSAAGYLVIRASLRAQGHDVDRVFVSDAFLGSHEAVVEAVMSGAADVGATYVYRDPDGQAVVRAGWGAASPQVIAYAGPIPSDVIAASIRMPVPQIRAVQRALANRDDAALAHAARQLLDAEGFIEARPEHLAPLDRLLSYLDDHGPPSLFPPPLS